MFTDNKDFYPTPDNMAKKMLEKIIFHEGMKVLEPSAGKGDLAKALIKAYKKKMKAKNAGSRFRSNFKPLEMDVVEKDKNLQHILKGEQFRLVADDFLRFDTEQWYDLIVMNPPFSDGVKHVLKAIEMISGGGQLVAILNATNVKNPKTVYEKELVRKISDLGATFEFLEGEFATSETERKTNVEVVMMYFNVKQKKKKSIVIENLRKNIEEEKLKAGKEEIDRENYYVADGGFVESIVEQYQFEVNAGLRIIDEFYAAKKHFLNDFKEESASSILSLKLNSSRGDNYSEPKRKTLRNAYIKEVRAKYWKTLFKSREFESLFTSRVREAYNNQISKLIDYDFTLFNILQIQEDLSKTIFGSIEDSIVNLFDEFSHKHYYDETAKNIHLFNGWKTNKSWKINKKVIIPLNAYERWDGNLSYDYRVREKLNDLTKAMSYLDTKPFDPEALEAALKAAKTNKLFTQYFTCVFYKKGTCHITFNDEELLKKFNIYGSMKKGWLPPSYGQKKYEDMSVDEKAVVEDFEGPKSYAETLERKEYFLEDPADRKIELPNSQLLQLAYNADTVENKEQRDEIGVGLSNVENVPSAEVILSPTPQKREIDSANQTTEIVEDIVNGGVIEVVPVIEVEICEGETIKVMESARINDETCLSAVNNCDVEIKKTLSNIEVKPAFNKERHTTEAEPVKVIQTEKLVEGPMQMSLF